MPVPRYCNLSCKNAYPYRKAHPIELRACREELDLRRSAFAELLGVDVRTLARWEESDAVKPTVIRLVRRIQEERAADLEFYGFVAFQGPPSVVDRVLPIRGVLRCGMIADEMDG